MVIAWVVVIRFLLDLPTDSKVHLIAPVLFNVTAIAAILQGMRARKEELAGDLPFKEGIKTGMAISLVYAISACLFFVFEFLVSGPKLLMSEAGAQDGPMWKVAAFAYGGLFVGSLVFGMIYSTIIAFFLARRLPRESNEII